MDTVFRGVSPPLRACDNGDGTYSVSVVPMFPAAPGVDSIFQCGDIPLKAVDYGDGTYLLAVEAV